MSLHPVIEYLQSSRARGSWPVQKDRRFFNLLAEISAVEASSGTLYRDLKDLIVDGKAFKIKSPDFAASLLELSTTSGFGVGDELRFDNSVRKASEIAGNRIKDPFLDTCCLTRVAEKLLPHHSIDVKMHKLAIYQPGGHFLRHKDTNHGVNHMASLVVCLPVSFTGGDLLIKTSNGKETIGLSSSDNYATYAAFFTDCEHEVTAVEEGFRICLQYDVFAVLNPEEQPAASSPRQDHAKNSDGESDEENEDDEEFDSFDDEDEDEDEASALSNRLSYDKASYVADQTKIRALQLALVETLEKSKRPVAILCRHLYTTRTVDGSTLKGVDTVLYNAMTDHVEVKLCAILIDRYGDSWSAHPFDPNDEVEPAPRLFLGKCDGDSATMISEMPGSEYTGNEPAEAEARYFAFAMIMKKDPSRAALKTAFDGLVLPAITSMPPSHVSPEGGTDYQQAKRRFDA